MPPASTTPASSGTCLTPNESPEDKKPQGLLEEETGTEQTRQTEQTEQTGQTKQAAVPEPARDSASTGAVASELVTVAEGEVQRAFGGVRADEQAETEAEGEENEECEALEDKFRRCRVALRQVQADYKARVERSRALQDQLKRLDGAQLQEPQGSTSQPRPGPEATERLRMTGEARVAEALRSLDRKQHRLELLREKCRVRAGKLKRLQQARDGEAERGSAQAPQPGCLDPGLANLMLQERRQEATALRCDTEAQRQKLLLLGQDLQRVLDFMLRVNVEAAGGPSPALRKEEMLPRRLRAELQLSPEGRACARELLRSYRARFRRRCRATGETGAEVGALEPWELEESLSPSGDSCSSSSEAARPGQAANAAKAASASKASGPLGGAADSSRGARGPAASLAQRQQPPAASGFPASLLEEARLLRRSCNVEMRRVAAALAQDPDPDLHLDSSLGPAQDPDQERCSGGGSRGLQEPHGKRRPSQAQNQRQSGGTALARRRWAEQEFLRAAAWGDKETLEELMPVLAREEATTPTTHPSLHGWTAWHAAAAHGQASSVAVLHAGARASGSTHLLQGLEQPTKCGLVPLAVACIQGHVEVVRALLLANASVETRDGQGNSSLLWAAATSREETMKGVVQLLLGAQAEPVVHDRSGQSMDIDISFLLQVRASSPTGAGAGAGVGAGGGAGAAAAAWEDGRLLDNAGRGRGRGRASESETPENQQQQQHEQQQSAYYCIRASGRCPPEEGFLSKAVSQLKPPIRDNIGFARKADTQVLALLGSEELDLGVWSAWATNYTHAGLPNVLEASQAENSPTHPHRSRQALVLTSERLLLLEASSWRLLEMIGLSDVQKLLVSGFSETLLLLRLRRRPDLLLDLPQRQRFLDEVRLAVAELRWPGGGRDDPDPSRLQDIAKEPLVPLLDGRQVRIGTLAFLERDVFLLLAHAPESLLLTAAAPTVFFGFLDMQRRSQPRAAGAGVCWRWQRYFFLLKDGRGAERRLLWCHHPNAATPVDSAPISSIRLLRLVDASYGDLCMVIEWSSAPAQGGHSLPTLTLRARSKAIREDWARAIRSLQGPTR